MAKIIKSVCLALLITGFAAAPHCEDDLNNPGEGFGSKPLVLAVHGLDFNKLSCEEALVFNQALGISNIPLVSNAYACGFLQSQIESRKFPSPGEDYLAKDLKKLLPSMSDSIVGFPWTGAVKDSRETLPRLKEKILATAASAKQQGRPFIIIGHSWGTALTLEALAEMQDDGTAKANKLVVDKVVLLASPVGGKLYQLAVHNVIPYQNFFVNMPRAMSILRLISYHAKRDAISAPLMISDEDTLIDNDVDTAAIEKQLELKILKSVVTTNNSLDPKMELAQIYPPLSTPIWHSSYLEDKTLGFPSLDGRVFSVRLASNSKYHYVDAWPPADPERVRMLRMLYGE